MARYWIGAWEWETTGLGQGYWRKPALSAECLDLRSPADCAVPAVASGVGLFLTANGANLGGGYLDLGINPRASLSGVVKAALQTALSWPRGMAGATIEDAVWESLTTLSDPTGLSRCLPLVPNRRRWELVLGGQSVRVRGFDTGAEEFAAFREVHRRLYRAYRQDSLEGRLPPEKYLQILGYWVRKYGISRDHFRPDDLPDEGEREPATTITESFNTSDGDTLGPDLTWTEVDGDWDIVGNKAELQSVFGSTSRDARAESDLSSADHYAQGSCGSASVTSHGGVCARFASAAETFYAFYKVFTSGTDQQRLAKVVAGTLTQLGSDVAAPSDGTATLKVECNGSTIKGYHGGTEQISQTDTAITGGTRCGIFGTNPTGTGAKPFVDSFEASDLSSGTAYDESGLALTLLALTGRTDVQAMLQNGIAVPLLALLGETDAQAFAESGLAALCLVQTGRTDAQAMVASGLAVPLLAVTGSANTQAFAESGRAVSLLALLGKTDVQAFAESGRAQMLLALLGETDSLPGDATFVLLTPARLAEAMTGGRVAETMTGLRLRN